MKKKKYNLSCLIFMALCCDMGIFVKKLISPATNIITEALHIPGGIGTNFSIMFILIAAVLCDYKMSATLMSLVQSLIAIVIGTVGSMGMLAPIGYVIPGLVIDIVLLLSKKTDIMKVRTLWDMEAKRLGNIDAKTLEDMKVEKRGVEKVETMVIANGLAGVAAALSTNIIIFRLSGLALFLYLSVAMTSGVICGIIGYQVVKGLSHRIFFQSEKTKGM